MRIMKHNIGQFSNCYGCGVCAIACPRNIIEIRENANGFYEPFVSDEARCTDCGICLSVCAFKDTKVFTDVQSSGHDYYAAWSKDEAIRHEASSGGVGFILAKSLIEQGYRACGVRYNSDKNRAEHFIADTVEAYQPSIGSKYIPSYTFDGFSGLNREDSFFVTGTPCQIDSMRRWIRKTKMEHKFVLLDFFCHGVPSLNLWRKYLESAPVQADKDSSIKWRDKTNGWHDSWTIKITNGDQVFVSSLLRDNDLFYRFFLGNYCLGEACYRCKYKLDASAADIRIGDMWGSTYESNQKGVSALIALTERGKHVIASLENCQINSYPSSLVMEGQMRVAASKPLIYPLINRMLKGNKSLAAILVYVKLYNLFLLPLRLLLKIKNIIKR